MDGRPWIIAVDRNPRNLELLVEFLGQEGYRTLTGESLEQFDQILAARQEIALALVDIAGFDRRIWERCERLRAENIPFLVVSRRQSATVQQESFAHGARGVLVKPLVVKELLAIVRSLLEKAK